MKKKREIQNSVFRVDLAQKLWWFVQPYTWKKQAICLQKLQAVVYITFLLFNFLEEYIMVNSPMKFTLAHSVKSLHFVTLELIS